jgi:DNA repair exonuclease SbcCD ATPase subunit
MEKMTLTEALKKIGHLRKKQEQDKEQLAEYCVHPKNEVPRLKTFEAQSEKVRSLIQSLEDLDKEIVRIKEGIEYTNLMTLVSIAGVTRTIAGHIFWKRKQRNQITNALVGMKAATSRLQNSVRSLSDKPELTTYFDEDAINVRVNELQEYADSIDGRLEYVNATTPVIWPDHL